MKIPQILLIEVQHRPGQLAKVLQAVAELKLTIEGLDAVSRTQDKTTWELSIDVEQGQEQIVEEQIRSSGAARVIGQSDRVFDRHRGGKIDMVSTVHFEDLKVLRDVYTPGVARVCMAIHENKDLAKEYTGINRTVAIITDGTAILGLGDIGPVAGMPVMEGKAALFNQFGHLSGMPILIEPCPEDEFIQTVVNIAPSFGAIQLEDIGAPHCFEIEQRLTELLDIPVLHDDQHGTAVVVLGALLSAQRLAHFDLHKSVVGQIGLGAAGLGIARLLLRFGVESLLGADLSQDAMQRLEHAGGTPSSLEEVMEKSDVVIATTGVKGLIKPEMVRDDQIIFALSNPEPEIEPAIALERGARFAADGKNINNVLAFPGLFKGALDAGATAFTDEMLIAASSAIADSTHGEMLIPSPLSTDTHARVAQRVADAAHREDGRLISYQR
jgi:malate dehydrogenase (oxaloacetate-decarboxylating)